jgi:hypothetical protein
MSQQGGEGGPSGTSRLQMLFEVVRVQLDTTRQEIVTFQIDSGAESGGAFADLRNGAALRLEAAMECAIRRDDVTVRQNHGEYPCSLGRRDYVKVKFTNMQHDKNKCALFSEGAVKK